MSDASRDLTGSAKRLSEIMGIELDGLVEAIVHDGGSPRKHLLKAFIDDCNQSKSRAWWESEKVFDTKALIERGFKFSRRLMPNTSDEEQYEAICDTLKVLGKTDAFKYPLNKQKRSEQLNFAQLIEALNASDNWLVEINNLLEKSYYGTHALDNKARLGILIVWLVLGQGICSKGELSICLREIRSGSIRRHESMYWTSGCYEKRRGERRRQWLSEDILLVISSIDWSDPSCDLTSNSHAIRDALNSLKRYSVMLKSLNQMLLFRAGAGRALFVGKLPTFAVEYARGSISSSSLPEDRLASLLKRRTCALDGTNTEDAVGVPILMDSKRLDLPDEPGLYEGLSDVPEIDSSVLTQLSRILSRSDKADAKRDAQALITKAIASNIPPLIEQILSWAQGYLKQAAPRTVKLGLDHLHARLIPVVDDLQIIDNPEHWASLVEEITANLDERSKAISALSSFAKYLSSEFSEEFATAGQTAYSGINAQCVSVEEVKSALTILERELDPNLYRVAKGLMMLAYGVGLRRSEVDGLIKSDFELETTTPVVKIRQHRHRALKTTNAKRNLPLHLVEAFFPDGLDLIKSLEQSASTDLVFNQYGHQCLSITDRLFNRITQALQEATDNPKVKFHSLRHTFCCYLLLGLFYDKLNLSALKHDLPLIDDVAKLRRVLPGILGDSGTSDRFELSTVRSMLGHLQESTSLLHYFHFMDVMRFAGMNRPEARIQISSAARHGTAGLKRNTRASGSKLKDGTKVFYKIIASSTHELPPAPESKVAKHVQTFVASNRIRITLDEVFSLCRKVMNDEMIHDHPIEGWGIATTSSIKESINQIHEVFLTGALAKDSQRVFDRLADKGAIDCYQTMLGCLSKLDQDAMRHVAEDLVWLASRRVTPYVTYRLESYCDAQRAVDLLHNILSGYELKLSLLGKVKDGRKRVAAFEVNIQSGQGIPAQVCDHYLLKIYRGEDQFPHRALSHLTSGLMLCLKCVKA